MVETRSRTGLLVALMLMVALAVVLTNVFPFRQILAQQRAVSNAETRLEVLQTENARLSSEADALRSDAEIERIARSDFGFVRPGDTSFVVVEPTPQLGEILPQADPAPPVLESRSFGGAIWDFLTGRDLVDDG
jgi:cell division protein FtsB